MKWHSAELRDTLTMLKTRPRHARDIETNHIYGRMGRMASRPANVDPKIVFIENPDVCLRAENIQEKIQQKTESVGIHEWRNNQDFKEFFEKTIKPNEPHVLLYIFPYNDQVVDGDKETVEYIKWVLGENSESYILPVIICDKEETNQTLMEEDQGLFKRFCRIVKNQKPEEMTEEQVNKLMEKIREVVDGNNNEGYKWKNEGISTTKYFKVLFTENQ